jgi:hypothetical protein
VSILQGAVDADHNQRMAEEIERANREASQGWGDFNRSGL